MSVYRTLVSHNRVVHAAMTRLLERLLAALDDPSVSTADLTAGARACVTVFRAHHRFEDDLVLPRVRTAPGPWAELATDHERLAAELVRLERAVDGADRAALAEPLRALLRAWTPHAVREEDALTESLWRSVLPESEAGAFGRDVARHSRANLRPASRLLPLLLYNLDPEERRTFTARMPAFVVRGLVPFAFRPAWRRLRPFMTFPPRRLSVIPGLRRTTPPRAGRSSGT